MEVHHHPKVEKKNFKEYFLEFLMIFLAVTLGFFAENIREHINERQHECNLMKMFVQDLTDDISKLDSSINFNTSKEIYLDSLKRLSIAAADHKLSSDDYRTMYYVYVAYGYNDYSFQPSKRTLDQLEESDGFNIICKQNVSDSIRLYSENDNDIANQHTVFLEEQDNEEHSVGETIFDISLFSYCSGSRDAYKILQSSDQFRLLTNDRNALLLYASKLLSDRGLLINCINQLKSQRASAVRLTRLIQQEYNFKD